MVQVYAVGGLADVAPGPIKQSNAPPASFKGQLGQSYFASELGNREFVYNGQAWVPSNAALASGTIAAAAITLNGALIKATFTGETTAAGAQEAFTITNSSIAADSALLVTVANVGSNDARMTLEQVKPADGSVVINTQNNGAAALNGDVIISVQVLS